LNQYSIDTQPQSQTQNEKIGVGGEGGENLTLGDLLRLKGGRGLWGVREGVSKSRKGC